MTREEMIAVAEIGETQGALEKQETQVIKNLLTMDKILAEDVMTPSRIYHTLIVSLYLLKLHRLLIFP